MAGIRCTNCGKELNENAKFCRQCGTAVPDEKPTAGFCRICGAPRRPGAAFCLQCGTPVAKKETSEESDSAVKVDSDQTGQSRDYFCRYCGAKLKYGRESVFCPQCGTPVGTTETAAAGVMLPNRTADVTSHNMPESAAVANPVTDSVRTANQTANQAANRTANQAAKANVKKTKKKKKKHPVMAAVSLVLAGVLLVEFVIAGWKDPGWFVKKEDPAKDMQQFIGDVPQLDQEVLNALGITQEDYEKYCQAPIVATVENSPGNPAFIELSFTQEEYNQAKTLSAPVSWETPTADFPEFGIHVDLKWWNLENETDTLIVKQLPEKECPNTGVTLYTYDFSLQSGQKEFPTQVEVTIPIQGDVQAFDGVLHRNEDTGKLEEEVYELSEDKMSYTAYLTHFSEDVQKSDNDRINQMRREGLDIDAYYQYDGKSLFRLMPYEDKPKNVGAKTWLYGIGLVTIPDFKKFMSAEDRYAASVLELLVNETGGVPMDAGLAESYNALGGYTDEASLTQTVTQPGLESKFPALANTRLGQYSTAGLGAALWAYGSYCLGMKMYAQYQNGASVEKIAESNKWSIGSAIIGGVGTGAAILGFGTIALGCSIICGCIFVATKVSETMGENAKQTHPLGQPVTLEQAAYFHYLTDFDCEYPVSASNALYEIVSEDPPAGVSYENLKKIKLSINGKGWAQALNQLTKLYHEEPAKLNTAIKKLYDFTIYSFWDTWNYQGSTVFKRKCWAYACRDLLRDYHSLETDTPGYLTDTYFYAKNDTNEDRARSQQAEANLTSQAEYLHISVEELERRLLLTIKVTQYCKEKKLTWDEAWEQAANQSEIAPEIFPESGINCQDFMRFDQVTREDENKWTIYARDVLYINTNSIVYAVYDKFYNQSIEELREMLYQKVLPWLNTHVTFYVDDSAYYQDKTKITEYDSFVFACDTVPLFSPSMGNKDDPESFRKIKGFGLKMEVRPDTDVLLETNIYHYLRFGCPTEVRISDNDGKMESVTGTATWDNVAIMADPNALYNADPVYENYLKKGAKGRLEILDLRVPIKFAGKKKEVGEIDLGMLYGTYTMRNRTSVHHAYINEQVREPIPYDVTFTVNQDNTFEISVPDFHMFLDYPEYSKSFAKANIYTEHKLSGFSLRGKIQPEYFSQCDYEDCIVIESYNDLTDIHIDAKEYELQYFENYDYYQNGDLYNHRIKYTEETNQMNAQKAKVTISCYYFKDSGKKTMAVSIDLDGINEYTVHKYDLDYGEVKTDQSDTAINENGYWMQQYNFIDENYIKYHPWGKDVSYQ